MLSKDKLLDIVNNWNTPFYLFDLFELRKRVEMIKKIFSSDVKICYAMKANPFLISYISDLVDKYEVCSPGEYIICKKEKIVSEKIILSGVYKKESDIQETFADDFNGVYTVESLEQYEILRKNAQTNKKEIELLVRISSGNQFGLDQEDVIKMILENDNSSYVKISGIHYFSGTQKKNIKILEKEINDLITFCEHLQLQYGIKIENIEYGAGLFYDYFNENEANYEDAVYLSDLIKRYKSKYHFTIELGRYLVASCGQYITKVVDVKKINHKNYCIVDGGIHHINYYGQLLGIKVPSVYVLRKYETSGEAESWNVCGALCTIHDVLLKNFKTEKVCINDYFVFNNVGAYSVTETGYLFLSRNLPLILAAAPEISVIRQEKSLLEINSREV